MIGYFIKELGSTAGVKTYELGRAFQFISILKNRPILDSKGIMIADNLWSIITADSLDSGRMVQIDDRKYKVRSTSQGMSGMRKVMLEAQNG